MGSHTELVFCDDQSEDGTADEVRRIQAKYPEKDIKLVNGPGLYKAGTCGRALTRPPKTS